MTHRSSRGATLTRVPAMGHCIQGLAASEGVCTEGPFLLERAFGCGDV
jgi:hypothetical protein